MKIIVLDFIFKFFFQNVLQGGFHIASVIGIEAKKLKEEWPTEKRTEREDIKSVWSAGYKLGLLYGIKDVIL